MATYRKRSKGWFAEVNKLGVRAYATFPTKAQAQQWAAEKEVEILSDRHKTIAENKYFKDALLRYVNEVSPTKKSTKFEKKKRLFYFDHRWPTFRFQS